MLFSSDTMAQQIASNADAGEIHSSTAGDARFFVAGSSQPDTHARRQELLTELLLAAGHAPKEAAQGEIRYHESGQPYASLHSKTKDFAKTYPISISHCRLFLAIALSTQVYQRIGLDAEQVDRTAHPALRRRILSVKAAGVTIHPEQQITTLRLWTLKEAFLKMAGSGLRVPMRDVEIRPESVSASSDIECYSARSPAHQSRLYNFQKDGIMLAISLEIR